MKNNNIITALMAMVLIVGLIAAYFLTSNTSKHVEVTYTNGIEISKAHIDKPTFFHYEIDGKPMEVVAVKDENGVVRIAYNTCQVCKDSGNGYFKAEGSFLVCQNCRSAFRYEEVGVDRGGCNPVPIENLIEDEERFFIPHDVLEGDFPLFDNWKAL